MIPKLNTAEWYAKTYFYLGNPDGCVNQCRRVSAGFCKTVRKLLRRRVTAHLPTVILLAKPRRKFPRRHRWYKQNPKHFNHHVCVFWSGVVIDFTRRQFDPRASFPHYELLAKTKKDWRVVRRERWSP